MLAAGVPLIDVSKWLGHSDVGTTARIYVHRNFIDKIASAEAVKWADDIAFMQPNDLQEVES